MGESPLSGCHHILTAKNSGVCLVHERKLRAGGLPSEIFFRNLLSKMQETTTLQNSTKILLQWGGLSRYHMSTVFQKTDFQEFSRSVYIFQELNCIPGVSRSFQEQYKEYKRQVMAACYYKNNKITTGQQILCPRYYIFTSIYILMKAKYSHIHIHVYRICINMVHISTTVMCTK